MILLLDNLLYVTYFNSDKVLEMSDGIDNLGGLNPHLTICLIAAWVLVFLALLKGVQSLGFYPLILNNFFTF